MSQEAAATYFRRWIHCEAENPRRKLQLSAIASECFWCAPQNLLGLIKVCE